MRHRTNIVTPTALTINCAAVALRFRQGEFGAEVRPHHRDAVFLHPPGAFAKEGGMTDGAYRIDVWGDPNGSVSVHGFFYEDPPWKTS